MAEKMMFPTSQLHPRCEYPDKVERYVEMFRQGLLPSEPIRLLWVEAAKAWALLDGNHRARAAQLAGVPVLWSEPVV